MTTPGRNDPCPCRSGKKFKHCCLRARDAALETPGTLAWRRLRRAVDDFAMGKTLLEFVVTTYGPRAADGGLGGVLGAGGALRPTDAALGALHVVALSPLVAGPARSVVDRERRPSRAHPDAAFPRARRKASGPRGAALSRGVSRGALQVS